MDISSIGKLLIVAGVLIAVAGTALVLGAKVPGLGRLPGDLVVRREGFTLFVPIVSMLIISVALTILLNLVFRWFR
jgi:hypothetical protein